MKRILLFSTLLLGLGLVAVVSLSLTLISDTSTTGSPTPDLTATALCQVATLDGELYGYWIFGTPTPNPLATATPIRALGDPARGQQTFEGIAGCYVCHSTTDETVIVGPSLQSIADRAGTRRADMDAETYLRGAILKPYEVIVSMGKPNIMPSTYARTLKAEQIDDLVAYLLTLHG